jgi:hypothetical protein
MAHLRKVSRKNILPEKAVERLSFLVAAKGRAVHSCVFAVS